VVLPGAGHASNQDNPAAFTAAVAAFLDRVLPARAPEPRPEAPARGWLSGLLGGLCRGGAAVRAAVVARSPPVRPLFTGAVRRLSARADAGTKPRSG
jgi:hypothetical protein